MKFFRPVFFTIITLALILTFNNSLHPGNKSIPPLGKFLSPFTGFWQNAESLEASAQLSGQLKGLHEDVVVRIDSQQVPHIFAKNEHDLYFMQGYLTARDRLWQMEFMIRAASGRVSEVFGGRAQEYDRTIRRIGLPQAAKVAIERLDTDTVARHILNAYSEGVNTYIRALSPRSLPFEYKLLDYQPELWTPLNSALLLKYMANMLTGKDYDFEYTNTLKFLDRETFNMLFPDFPQGIDPIIPAGTEFNFQKEKDASGHHSSLKSTGNVYDNTTEDLSMVHRPASIALAEPPPANGSNNWAVSGDKSVTGSPILCNDPHLKLQLPPIWYQLQLNAPGVNVYGVSIPGSPGIIIGFNEHIAWGVTNGSMDVKDWYSIRFKDASKNEYLFDGNWMPTKKIVEEIKIRDKETVYDTVVYTQHGPVAYDNNFTSLNKEGYYALRWTAHDASKELKTFYLLNRAKNYEDYIEALNFFECPGQNFVFASQDGDIAIKEQGKFILRNPNEGKFIQDGTVSSTLWKGFIPFENNPHIKNPSRGFVSSANQHPTDTTYPYYYQGIYEYYRNRRINNILSSQEKFSVDDLKKLQCDNYNLMASEVLPYLLSMIEPNSLNEDEINAFRQLASWNYYNDRDLIAPTYFTVMWDSLMLSLWDEFYPEAEKGVTAPNYYNTIAFLINHPEHPLIDRQDTPQKETLPQLVQQSFRASVSSLMQWHKKHNNLTWGFFKGTTLAHYIPGIDALNIMHLPIGGDVHIVNATSKTHGPSWRMVVELSRPVKAWGILPGGQSGNPGSRHYSDFAMKWANGEYYELVFLQKADEDNEKIILTKNIQPLK